MEEGSLAEQNSFLVEVLGEGIYVVMRSPGRLGAYTALQNCISTKKIAGVDNTPNKIFIYAWAMRNVWE